MLEYLSASEFTLPQLNRKLEELQQIQLKKGSTRARSECAEGKARSLAHLTGKTAVLPSIWAADCHWQPDVPRSAEHRVEWLYQHSAAILNSPLEFEVPLLQDQGSVVMCSKSWIQGERRLGIMLAGYSPESEAFACFAGLLDELVGPVGAEQDQVVEGQPPVRIWYPCGRDITLAILPKLLEDNEELVPDDGVWLVNAANLGDVLDGQEPSKVAESYSSMSPETCDEDWEYSFGVLFDLAVELANNLHCPEGLWEYSVKYMDCEAIAESGIDRSNTVLFDQPERKVLGILDTSFGNLQLNRQYGQGVYRFELQSKHPLLELPPELRGWGVEFDLSQTAD